MVWVSGLGWGRRNVRWASGSIETGHTRRGDVVGVWLPGDQHGSPVGHAADEAGEPSELAERPTASEPRCYDCFCNVAATATGLVTVSKTGDSD
jgi:hypothetical protein